MAEALITENSTKTIIGTSARGAGAIPAKVSPGEKKTPIRREKKLWERLRARGFFAVAQFRIHKTSLKGLEV